MPTATQGSLERLKWRRFMSKDDIKASERNHPAARAFPSTLERQVEAMIADGVVKEVTWEESQSHPVVVNPVNIVVKNADRVRVLVACTGIARIFS